MADSNIYGLHDNQPSSVWTSGPQTVPNSTEDQSTGALKFGAGIGALALLGRLETKSGKRGFDFFANAARRVEEYSPGYMFRTFQISHMLSGLESASLHTRYISPAFLTKLVSTEPGVAWLKNISRLTGKNLSSLLESGFRFEGGQILSGRVGGDVLLKYASVMRAPTGAAPGFQQAYVRSLKGGPIYEGIVPKSFGSRAAEYESNFARQSFAKKVRYLDKTGKIHEDIFMFTGGKSRAQAAKRFLFGYTTALTERINQLARAPFELEPIATFFKKVPLINRLQFGVVSSSGLRTLAKITGKLGVIGTGAYLAYQQIDFEARNAEILNSTILSEGITAGLATLYTRGNLAMSKAAEKLGMHDYRETQEEVAPGSTELLKLAAFPIIGMLGGLTVGYGQRVARQIGFRRMGMDIAQASIAASAEDAFFKQGIYSTPLPDDLTAIADPQTLKMIKQQSAAKLAGWQGNLGRKIATKQAGKGVASTFLRMLGQVTPSKVKFLVGTGLGLAMVTPFLPGALLPGTRPDELEELYIGKKQVAIRKGRWWEFGRCLSLKSRVYKDYGISVCADEVEPGDYLLTKSGRRRRVLSVTRRSLQKAEQVFEIRSSVNRSKQEVFITEEHPFLTSHGWKAAKDVQVNDWIAFPRPELTDSIHELDDVLLTKELGFLVGHFLAEGNLMRKRGEIRGIELCSSLLEEGYLIKDRDVINQIWGKYNEIKEKKGQGVFRLRPGCKLLGKWFADFLYQTGDKLLPDYYLHLNIQFLKGLLDGYWSGDGGWDKGMGYITSARLGLLEQIHAILLALGIPSSIHEHSSYSKQVNKFCFSWKLIWNHNDWINFEKSQLKRKNIHIDKEYIWGRVYKKEIVDYLDDVIDFEIQEDHSFVTVGMIVHNSAYEGGRIDRYEDHWYKQMLARAKDKSLYGEEEISPIKKFYLENFTYELEKKHYADRPYPITGTAFEDVPFIGPLLSATIGRFIKPPKLMHREEWLRGELGEEGSETLRPHLRFGQEVTEGEAEFGSPVSPYDTKSLIGEQIYRMTEMVGLPGFTMTAIKEAVTGEADTFAQKEQLESARRMYGAEREYWDKDLGGGLGTTELVRRLYPHRRRQIKLYNPIRNTMPEWLPGPGGRSMDFQHGDPYVKVMKGESRLPGVGYAALNPDLEGLDPADYPVHHRFKILADIAPYTDEYRQSLSEVRAARKEVEWTKEQEELYQRTLEQVKSKKVRKQFTPYKYKERARTPMEEILARANEKEKEDRDPSWFERTVGRYWETITHNIETPFEFLTPMSPGAKLVHARTAVEDYEKTQVYGTQNAFWGHPIRDFFTPFVDSMAAAVGIDAVPQQVQEKRNLEEYFDILKYVKNTRLKNQAEGEENTEAVKEYEDRRHETLFGINPFTHNFSNMFSALPRRDRDYFNEFIEADMEERKKIMKLIPENEQQLMIARWKLKDIGDMEQAVEEGLLTEEQVEKANEAVADLFKEKETEGLPKTEELWVDYLKTRQQGESYPDWYRRTKLLQKKLKGRPMPGADWVGWHPSVDLEDIKLKIVENEGRNVYDYDLWSDRERAVARRPRVHEAAEDLQSGMSANKIRQNIEDILSKFGLGGSRVEVVPNTGTPRHRLDLDLREDRHTEMQQMVRRGDFGG